MVREGGGKTEAGKLHIPRALSEFGLGAARPGSMAWLTERSLTRISIASIYLAVLLCAVPEGGEARPRTKKHPDKKFPAKPPKPVSGHQAHVAAWHPHPHAHLSLLPPQNPHHSDPSTGPESQAPQHEGVAIASGGGGQSPPLQPLEMQATGHAQSPLLPVCFSKPEHFTVEGAPLLEAQDFPRQTHGQLRPVCGFRPIKTTYAICKHQNSRIVQMISKDCSLPRISPSLFASVMQNRTLWLWGDSLMGELFETVMQCSEKPKKMLPKGVSAGGGAKNHHKWGPIVELSQWFQRSTMDHGGFPAEVDYKCPFTKCIKLQSGTHVCFIRINNPRSHLTEDDGSMPCLRFVRPQDVLLLNAGLGEGRSLFEQWSGHQLHRLAAWKKARDAEGGSPTMIWREFYPQHFGNSPGGHFLGKPQAFKYGCQTKGIDIPEYERLNFRNDRANPVLQEAGYYVLPVWRWSLTIPHLHPLGLDCSHWCQYPGDKLEEEWNLLQMFVTGILAPNMLEGVQTMSTL